MTAQNLQDPAGADPYHLILGHIRVLGGAEKWMAHGGYDEATKPNARPRLLASPIAY